MQISVIVPVYNSENTLRECLNSIFASSVKPFEVIVVDDKSTDMSGKIAKEFPVKLINLDKNRGSGYARNIAVENSSGEIIFFIDADVKAKKESLGIVIDAFNEDPELDAIIGLFSKEHPNKDFFSQYKNLYMHFVFSRINGYVDFLFTSICAIKKNAYLNFSKTRLKADDTEAGQRYKTEHKKIAFNKRLEAVHLKTYNLISFVKNDFIVAYDWVRIFLKYRGIRHLCRYHRFAHAKLNQIISIMICPLSIASFITSGLWPQNRILAYLLLGAFLTLNARFFIFLYNEKGAVFALKSVIVTYIDMLVMGSGIFYGTLSYSFIDEKRIQ
jgi:glycosyltransferase involved in cell wall biosynthesis